MVVNTNIKLVVCIHLNITDNSCHVFAPAETLDANRLKTAPKKNTLKLECQTVVPVSKIKQFTLSLNDFCKTATINVTTVRCSCCR